MSQPTPEQDKANGTVSAANTPHPDAQYRPATVVDMDAAELRDEETGATGTFDEAPSVLAGNTPADMAEALNEITPPEVNFAATSDEIAPNVGHVDYTEPAELGDMVAVNYGTSAGHIDSDTPVFDATPGHDEVSEK